MKKFNLLSTIIILLFLFTGCSVSITSNSAKTTSTYQTVTDSTGRKVKVPTKISKIADSWKAHNEILPVLGAGNKIVETSLTKKDQPWLYKVNPTMNKATSTFGTTFSAEELLKNKPDIVFASESDTFVDKLSNIGLPVVQVYFTNFTSMEKCISLTAKILGGNAIQRANEYNSYLDKKLKLVKDVTSKIPAANKPKVLHLQALNPLTVDGSNTIINDWINAAGGVNAAKEINGNMKEISVEQILKWNPDIIIVGANGTPASLDILLKDSRLKNVAAIKNNRVYQNPAGAFDWDRYGCEEALQIQWAAKTLYPSQFKSLDMVAETKYFYKTFLNYNLTTDETNRILKAETPIN